MKGVILLLETVIAYSLYYFPAKANKLRKSKKEITQKALTHKSRANNFMNAKRAYHKIVGDGNENKNTEKMEYQI